MPDQTGINTTSAIGVTYSNMLLGGALSITGSYVHNKTDLDAAPVRDYTAGGAVTQRDAQTDASNGTNTNHRLSLRTQVDVPDRTQLTVEPQLTVQRNVTAGTLAGTTATPAGALLAQSLTTEAVDASAVSTQTEVLLRHRFATAGRTLTVGLDGGVDDQAGTSQQATAPGAFSDAITAAASGQLFDTDALTRTLGATVRYTEPVGARGRLQLRYRSQRS